MQEIYAEELEVSLGGNPLLYDHSAYKDGIYYFTIENNGKQALKKIEIVK